MNINTRHPLTFVCLGILFLISTAVCAQDIEISNAWARATVLGQTTSGVFMDIRSNAPAQLISAATPVATTVEIHQMQMDGNMMHMRQIDTINLPTGKLVKLDSSNYHIMLINLQTPLKAGTFIPLTLNFQDAQKRIIAKTLSVSVQTAMPPKLK